MDSGQVPLMWRQLSGQAESCGSPVGGSCSEWEAGSCKPELGNGVSWQMCARGQGRSRAGVLGGRLSSLRQQLQTNEAIEPLLPTLGAPSELSSPSSLGAPVPCHALADPLKEERAEQRVTHAYPKGYSEAPLWAGPASTLWSRRRGLVLLLPLNVLLGAGRHVCSEGSKGMFLGKPP